MHELIQTTVLHIDPKAIWKMVVRASTDDMPSTIRAMEEAWDSFDSGYPFDYQFVDESFGAMYQEETKLSQLLWVFTFLAIIIAAIGIFGLSTHSVQQRRGEIGIRKVLGASPLNLVTLLSKEYIVLILIAVVLSAPLSWYLMNNWLMDFSYRIQIDGWIYVLATTIILAIAGATISYQNIRAAMTDPVNAIRSE